MKKYNSSFIFQFIVDFIIWGIILYILLALVLLGLLSNSDSKEASTWYIELIFRNVFEILIFVLAIITTQKALVKKGVESIDNPEKYYKKLYIILASIAIVLTIMINYSVYLNKIVLPQREIENSLFLVHEENKLGFHFILATIICSLMNISTMFFVPKILSNKHKQYFKC